MKIWRWCRQKFFNSSKRKEKTFLFFWGFWVCFFFFHGILKKKVAKESDISSVFKIGEKCEIILNDFFFASKKKKKKKIAGVIEGLGHVYSRRWLVDRVGLRFRITQNKACRLDATKDIKEKCKLMTNERDFRLQN